MTGPEPMYSKEQLMAALSESGSIAGAARQLRVSRTTVYKWVKRYGIEVAPPTRRVAA